MNIAGERIAFVSAASYIISRKKALRYFARGVASYSSATAISIWAKSRERAHIFNKGIASTIVSWKGAHTGTKPRSSEIESLYHQIIVF